MRVLTVGGGSGGHVTPVLAVINELSKLDPKLEILFVCDKQFEAQSRGLMEHASVKVQVKTISAGKLRRYSGVPLWKQLLDVKTDAHNVIDSLKVTKGVVQSLRILRRYKPEVVFAKGGYVCLPMGLAAHLMHIPLVIHDSDTRPGLTNRVLAKWASQIGTGAPVENYNYPKAITHYVGVPIHPEFKPFTAAEQQAAKAAIGIVDLTKPLITVVGGGLGAKSINDAMLAIAPKLLDQGRAVYHITGKKHVDAVGRAAPDHPDYHVVPFVYKDMVQVLGAADVVVSRGSATFLQELAALCKPVVIVPAKHLSDQVKNAEVFKAADAAIVLTDDQLIDQPMSLYESITELITEPARAKALASHLHAFARPEAALDVARLVVEAVTTPERPTI